MIRLASARKHPRLLSTLAWLAIVLVLATENGWIFRDHYAGRATIPYDFSLSYYTVPFYWQALARIGIFPRWIPFQSFGYPVGLNLQAGLFYPPFWLLVLLRITYSMRAAIVVEWLHVLAGAIGASYLARARHLSWWVTLLAGCAYQFFGGFFSNAQHADIVRGYAIVPWLLAALTLSDEESPRRLAARNWLVAPAVLFLCTGAYPGQIPASLLLGFVYLVIQTIDLWPDRAATARRLRVAAIRGAMIALGLGIATVSLAPGFTMKHEILRSSEATADIIFRSHLQLDHLFTTLFGYDVRFLTGDVSMRSLFITVPIVLGLFFVSWSDVKRHRSLIVVSLVAALLIQDGFVFHLLLRLLPPLGLSRFPTADYRALVALPMTILGALGLGRLFEGAPISGLALRAALALGFVLIGAERFHWRSLDARQIGELGFVVVTTWALMALALRRALPTVVLVALAVALITFDGARMHHLVERTWNGHPDLPGYSVSSDYERARRELQRHATEVLARRPVREFSGRFGTWSPNLEGYMRGTFTADDYAASERLRVIDAIRKDPALLRYMIADSSPRLLDPAAVSAGAAAALDTLPGPGSVAIMSFRAEELRYHVAAAHDAVLVENEPAFPGWTGVIGCDTAARATVTPEPALWPLRAWRLPAGEYDLCVRFRFPGLTAGAVVSAVALALWLGLMIWCLRSRVKAVAVAVAE